MEIPKPDHTIEINTKEFSDGKMLYSWKIIHASGKRVTGYPKETLRACLMDAGNYLLGIETNHPDAIEMRDGKPEFQQVNTVKFDYKYDEIKGSKHNITLIYEDGNKDKLPVEVNHNEPQIFEL